MTSLAQNICACHRPFNAHMHSYCIFEYSKQSFYICIYLFDTCSFHWPFCQWANSNCTQQQQFVCVLISGKTGVSQVNAKQMCLVVFLLIVLYFKDKNLSNSIANLAQRPHILPSHETPIERGFGMTWAIHLLSDLLQFFMLMLFLSQIS